MSKNAIRTSVMASIAALATSTGAQAQAVQWRVEDGGNGHWYRTSVSPIAISWYEARDRSLQAGGHLATLTSAAENAWAHARTLDAPGAWGAWNGGWEYGPWIGAYRNNAADSQWKWVSGEAWGFTAWHSSQPDASFQIVISFGGGGQSSATWGDTAPDEPVRSYVIEWSADCNSDGIVDYGQCNDGTLADYDGNNIPDCCERGEACEIGMYPVQWRSSEGGNGHWYQGALPPSAGVSWSGARSIAQGRGGDLVSLNTSQERSWVFEHVSGDPRLWTVTLGPWAGGYQPDGSPEPGGGWMWVDGTPVAEDFFWNKWHPDGNDNCGGPANRMSYWGMYVAGAGDLFADCADLQRFTCWNIDFGFHPSLVVEWSADCDNDGQVDIGQILRGEALDTNANGVPDHCEITCSDADLYANGEVNGADLGILLSEWGVATPGSRSDIDGDGLVNGVDLAYILAFWGPCGG